MHFAGGAAGSRAWEVPGAPRLPPVAAMPVSLCTVVPPRRGCRRHAAAQRTTQPITTAHTHSACQHEARAMPSGHPRLGIRRGEQPGRRRLPHHPIPNEGIHARCVSARIAGDVRRQPVVRGSSARAAEARAGTRHARCARPRRRSRHSKLEGPIRAHIVTRCPHERRRGRRVRQPPQRVEGVQVCIVDNAVDPGW